MSTRYEAIRGIKTLLHLTEVTDETMDPQPTLLPQLNEIGISQQYKFVYNLTLSIVVQKDSNIQRTNKTIKFH